MSKAYKGFRFKLGSKPAYLRDKFLHQTVFTKSLNFVSESSEIEDSV